ncbi:hypothetical protein C8D88_102730 [Lentzea atacamensis]|uniref:Uncharacterized protein n=1 Tax=Lentzea atacamensis TaxID=531938 RepID=A0A316I7L2_9PSEU|nr:hypothetical protein [Lentzea atacamensis]PWK89457.1 hypothetical protein C8D88_102730 [Lentzea atacamensis]
MTALPVEAITGYLRATGWYPQPRMWTTLTVWTHDDGAEVLVPARDGMNDAELRVRELLQGVAAREGRAVADVALDIATPPADMISVHTHPPDAPSGWSSLSFAVENLTSLTNVVHATTRAVDQGAYIGSRGRLPKKVHDMVGRMQVGPARAGSCVLPVRVPVDDYARRVLVRLNTALDAVRMAVAQDDPAAFRHAVVAGASADLCDALSGFAGEQAAWPFGFSFRWAAGDAPGHTVPEMTFDAGAGARIRAGARFLRTTQDLGTVTVTGLVRTARIDRMVQVDTVWMRLLNLTWFDAAVTAQKEKHPVTVSGWLVSEGRRAELKVDRFDVIDCEG